MRGPHGGVHVLRSAVVGLEIDAHFVVIRVAKRSGSLSIMTALFLVGRISEYIVGRKVQGGDAFFLDKLYILLLKRLHIWLGFESVLKRTKPCVWNEQKAQFAYSWACLLLRYSGQKGHGIYAISIIIDGRILRLPKGETVCVPTII